MHIVHDPSKGNKKQLQNYMSKYHPKTVLEFQNNTIDKVGMKHPLIGIEKFVAKKQKVEDMLKAIKSNQAIADDLLTLGVAKPFQLFSIVEDEGFIQYINYIMALNQRIEIPSRKSIHKTSNDVCSGLFDQNE